MGPQSQRDSEANRARILLQFILGDEMVGEIPQVDFYNATLFLCETVESAWDDKMLTAPDKFINRLLNRWKHVF